MAAQIFGDFARRVKSEEIESDPLKLDQFFGQSVVQEGSSLESFYQALDAIDTQHPEVLDRLVLKKFYHHLVYWSLHCSDIRNSKPGRDKRFNGVRNVCDVLFGELSNRFDRLHSALFSVPEVVITGRYGLDLDMWGAQPEFNLLLRCCILIVPFLESDQSILMEKCEILLSILSKLCSPDLPFLISRHVREVKERIMKFRRLVSYECTNPGDGLVTAVLEDSQTILYSAKHSTSPMPLFSSILEVFMDELLVHKHLRQYFVAIDAVSCSKEKILRREFDYADGVSNLVIELISAHFLLLASDEQAFTRSLNRLSWLHDKGYPTTEVRLVSAMSFLGDPVMFTAPQLLQAYGISLVNSCIANSMASDSDGFNCKMMNCYLSAFERAFYLYTSSISSMKLENRSSGAESGSASRRRSCSSRRSFCPSFQSCLRPVTFDNIMLQVAKLADKGCSPPSEMVSNLLTSFTADIAKDELILNNSYRDELLLNLNYIISKFLLREAALLFLAFTFKVGFVIVQPSLLYAILHLVQPSLLYAIHLCRLHCINSLVHLGEFHISIGCRNGRHSLNSTFILKDVLHSLNQGLQGAKAILSRFPWLAIIALNSHLDFLARSCICVFFLLSMLHTFKKRDPCALQKAFAPVAKDEYNEKIYMEVPYGYETIIATKYFNIQIFTSTTTLFLVILQDSYPCPKRGISTSFLKWIPRGTGYGLGRQGFPVERGTGRVYVDDIIKKLQSWIEIVDAVKIKIGLIQPNHLKDFRIIKMTLVSIKVSSIDLKLGNPIEFL
ncbi:hypothetical protein Sjap_023016 [Stephania japonica]|uniref:DUF7812 domain-containing protein n=1 Tax=Stephania japonica TaxID=461633 RepID=A0AAP0EQF5_9MAGN